MFVANKKPKTWVGGKKDERTIEKGYAANATVLQVADTCQFSLRKAKANWLLLNHIRTPSKEGGHTVANSD